MIEYRGYINEERPSHFVGNVETRFYHKPSCKRKPAEWNEIIFKTELEAREKRYKRCHVCFEEQEGLK